MQSLRGLASLTINDGDSRWARLSAGKGEGVSIRACVAGLSRSPADGEGEGSGRADEQLVDAAAVEIDDLELPALFDEAFALARQVAEHSER